MTHSVFSWVRKNSLKENLWFKKSKKIMRSSIFFKKKKKVNIMPINTDTDPAGNNRSWLKLQLLKMNKIFCQSIFVVSFKKHKPYLTINFIILIQHFLKRFTNNDFTDSTSPGSPLPSLIFLLSLPLFKFFKNKPIC